MSRQSDILLGTAIQFSPFTFAVWEAWQAETLLSAPVAPCAVPGQARHLVNLLRVIANQATTVHEILDVANELEASIEPHWSGAGTRPYACITEPQP